MASRLYKILALVVFMAACQNKSPETVSSLPGKETRGQIYFLLDSQQKPLWWHPDPRILENQSAARIEVKTVNSSEEAEEQLRVWNGRPVDILILGPGHVQMAWKKLQLPKVPKRIVLALGGQKDPSWTDLSVDNQEVGRFLEQGCQKAFETTGCSLYGNGTEALSVSKPLLLNGLNIVFMGLSSPPTIEPTARVSLQWSLILDELLNPKGSAYSQTPSTIGFGSGYLKAEYLGKKPKEKTRFEGFVQQWILAALNKKSIL